MFKINIDATNIKAGGGLTHLKKIIENNSLGNESINLIGGNWLNTIEDRKNVLRDIYTKEFTNIFNQEFFKKFKLKNILNKGTISFIPGGTFSSKTIDYVSMSQNMLIFEKDERNRFPKSFTWLRYLLLEKLQVRSFSNAKAIIYISNYAKNFIENKYPYLKKKPSKVIYHGISDEFRQVPKLQKAITEYSIERPLKITYISIISYYKHQLNVIEAVKMLHREGVPIALDLIGPMYQPIRKKFERSLKGTESFISYIGKIPYEEISGCYKTTDIFLYASTCENMPNILVEAMSAGQPIISSNHGPMPEILRDAGVYMNPTDISSIYENLKKIIYDTELRTDIAEKAYEYSQEFSWKKASKETFEFIIEIAKQNKQ